MKQNAKNIPNKEESNNQYRQGYLQDNQEKGKREQLEVLPTSGMFAKTNTSFRKSLFGIRTSEIAS